MPVGTIPSDPATIDRRLRARITPLELAATAFVVGMLGVFVYIQSKGSYPPYDYNNYIRAVHGDTSFYYYGYWFLPVFSFLSRLPGSSGYLLWGLANVAAMFFACRVFGGRVAFALATYQMIYIVFYGQITGVVVGGAALCWWGITHRRLNLAGLGLLIAGTKFQTGLTLSLFLWLFNDLTWRERARILLLPLIVVAVSLVVYPGWPLTTLYTLQTNPPNNDGSMTLWRFIGPLSLILWLPPILLPMSRSSRIIALTATSALALPYFQQADLISLFALPVGWTPLLGNLGYLGPVFGLLALQMLFIIPLLVYLAYMIQALRGRLAAKGRGSNAVFMHLI
jgi:hypothetical protein